MIENGRGGSTVVTLAQPNIGLLVFRSIGSDVATTGAMASRARSHAETPAHVASRAGVVDLPPRRANVPLNSPANPSPGAAPTPVAKRHEVLGLFTLCIALLLVLALASFDARGGKDWCGPIGASIAEALVAFLGTAALLLPWAFLVLSIRLFRRSVQPLRPLHALGTMGIIAAIATALHLSFGERAMLGHLPPGGLLGITIGETLRALVGTAGAHLVTFTILLIALVVRTRLSVVSLASTARDASVRTSERAKESIVTVARAWQEAREQEKSADDTGPRIVGPEERAEAALVPVLESHHDEADHSAEISDGHEQAAAQLFAADSAPPVNNPPVARETKPVAAPAVRSVAPSAPTVATVAPGRPRSIPRPKSIPAPAPVPVAVASVVPEAALLVEETPVELPPIIVSTPVSTVIPSAPKLEAPAKQEIEEEEVEEEIVPVARRPRVRRAPKLQSEREELVANASPAAMAEPIEEAPPAPVLRAVPVAKPVEVAVAPAPRTTVANARPAENKKKPAKAPVVRPPVVEVEEEPALEPEELLPPDTEEDVMEAEENDDDAEFETRVATVPPPPPPPPPPKVFAGEEEVSAQKKKARVSAPAPAPAPVAPTPKPMPTLRPMRLPSTELLAPVPVNSDPIDEALLRTNAERLLKSLRDYQIEGRVAEIHPGPVVTTYEFVPAAGTKLSKIARLSDDIAMSLEASRVRIVAPIPGKGRVGFEIPNGKRQSVSLREMLETDGFHSLQGALPVAFGKDVVGAPYFADLAKMPHLIVAGSTGSGKSVGLNVMLTSLLFKRGPDQVRLLMIDPKMVELAVYDHIPHMLLPVVTDMKKASLALRWVVDEMERRYSLFAQAGARNITTYNERLARSVAEGKPLANSGPVRTRVTGTTVEVQGDHSNDALVAAQATSLPYILVVVDEFADLMMVAGKEVEAAVARLAQKARAAGIHVILATQRPSVDVITGVIKANFPSRVGFKVSSRIDSRTILDQQGAEHLLGMGDMLVLPPGSSDLRRVHCAYVSEDEVQAVTDHWRAQGTPTYDEDILRPREEEEDGPSEETELKVPQEKYEKAVALVLSSRRCSVSWIQRQLAVGYNVAARMVEKMERENIVGPPKGPGKDRDVLG